MQVEPFNVAIAPNTSEVKSVTRLLAQTLACSLPNYSLEWVEFKEQIDDEFYKIAPELYNSTGFQYSDLIGVRSFSERFLESSDLYSPTLKEACQGQNCYKNSSCWKMFEKRMMLFSSEEELMKQVRLVNLEAGVRVSLMPSANCSRIA